MFANSNRRSRQRQQLNKKACIFNYSLNLLSGLFIKWSSNSVKVVLLLLLPSFDFIVCFIGMLKFGACPLEKSQLDSSMSSNGGCRDGWMYRRMDGWMVP